MVGLLEDVDRRVRSAFRREGDVVALFGETRDELGASEFLRTIHGRDEGPCPEVDLAAERRLVDLLVQLAGERHIASAHDLSDGGLAVALAECAMSSGLGAQVRLELEVRPSSLLFGETTGRVLVTFEPAHESSVRSAADAGGVPFRVIGRVERERLVVAAGESVLVDEPVALLREVWTTAFARAIEQAPDVL
jgi:phosphoribosylformylglycinamidine synthase